MLSCESFLPGKVPMADIREKNLERIQEKVAYFLLESAIVSHKFSRGLFSKNATWWRHLICFVLPTYFTYSAKSVSFMSPLRANVSCIAKAAGRL